MATQKNKFTTVELAWAETQLRGWMDYLNAHPYESLEDRTKLRPTKNGGTVLEVVATIEAQQKHHRDTMKDYLSLLEIVEKLRDAEAVRQSKARGGIDIPDRMKDE